MKPLGEWTQQRVFFVVAGGVKLKKSWFRKDKFMQIAQMFMVQWKIGHFQGRSREDHQVQPSEKIVPVYPNISLQKRLPYCKKVQQRQVGLLLGPSTTASCGRHLYHTLVHQIAGVHCTHVPESMKF